MEGSFSITCQSSTSQSSKLSGCAPSRPSSHTVVPLEAEGPKAFFHVLQRSHFQPHFHRPKTIKLRFTEL